VRKFSFLPSVSKAIETVLTKFGYYYRWSISDEDRELARRFDVSAEIDKVVAKRLKKDK
jgi:hypothetical protein